MNIIFMLNKIWNSILIWRKNRLKWKKEKYDAMMYSIIEKKISYEGWRSIIYVIKEFYYYGEFHNPEVWSNFWVNLKKFFSWVFNLPFVQILVFFRFIILILLLIIFIKLKWTTWFYLKIVYGLVACFLAMRFIYMCFFAWLVSFWFDDNPKNFAYKGWKNIKIVKWLNLKAAYYIIKNKKTRWVRLILKFIYKFISIRNWILVFAKFWYGTGQFIGTIVDKVYYKIKRQPLMQTNFYLKKKVWDIIVNIIVWSWVVMVANRLTQVFLFYINITWNQLIEVRTIILLIMVSFQSLVAFIWKYLFIFIGLWYFIYTFYCLYVYLLVYLQKNGKHLLFSSYLWLYKQSVDIRIGFPFREGIYIDNYTSVFFCNYSKTTREKLNLDEGTNIRMSEVCAKSKFDYYDYLYEGLFRKSYCLISGDPFLIKHYNEIPNFWVPSRNELERFNQISWYFYDMFFYELQQIVSYWLFYKGFSKNLDSNFVDINQTLKEAYGVIHKEDIENFLIDLWNIYEEAKVVLQWGAENGGIKYEDTQMLRDLTYVFYDMGDKPWNFRKPQYKEMMQEMHRVYLKMCYYTYVPVQSNNMWDVYKIVWKNELNDKKYDFLNNIKLNLNKRISLILYFNAFREKYKCEFLLSYLKIYDDLLYEEKQKFWDVKYQPTGDPGVILALGWLMHELKYINQMLKKYEYMFKNVKDEEVLKMRPIYVSDNAKDIYSYYGLWKECIDKYEYTMQEGYFLSYFDTTSNSFLSSVLKESKIIQFQKRIDK